MDNQYNASCVGGAAGYIDRWVLGVNHIYSNPTSKSVYGSASYDPEGILGMCVYYHISRHLVGTNISLTSFATYKGKYISSYDVLFAQLN